MSLFWKLLNTLHERYRSLLLQRKLDRYDSGYSAILLLRFRYLNSLEQINLHLMRMMSDPDYTVDEWDQGAMDAFKLLDGIERTESYG